MQPVDHDPLQFGPEDTQVTSIDTATDTRHETRDTCKALPPLLRMQNVPGSCTSSAACLVAQQECN